MNSPFAIVPVEACMDPRLTKMQLRLLICLLSFRAKNTDTIWPKRRTISARCGYSISTISRVTAQLVDLGWLVKVGKGGFSKATEYRITVPEVATVDNEQAGESTVTGSETVDSPNGGQSGNGSQTGNGCRTDPNNGGRTGTFTVASPATRKEQTMNRPLTNHIPATTTRGRESSKIAYPITEDFMPSIKTIQTLRDQGVTNEFLDAYLPRFITYWLDDGKSHRSWDSVFLEQCEKQFDREYQPA